jgi:hypothetical protein
MSAKGIRRHAHWGSKTSAGDKTIGGQLLQQQEYVVESSKFPKQCCQRQKKITIMVNWTADVAEAAAA